MRTIMRTKITILTIFIMASISEQLFACRCQGESTVQGEIKQADAVLVGTIISKEFVVLVDSFFLRYNDTATIKKLLD